MYVFPFFYTSSTDATDCCIYFLLNSENTNMVRKIQSNSGVINSLSLSEKQNDISTDCHGNDDWCKKLKNNLFSCYLMFS